MFYSNQQALLKDGLVFLFFLFRNCCIFVGQFRELRQFPFALNLHLPVNHEFLDNDTLLPPQNNNILLSKDSVDITIK